MQISFTERRSIMWDKLERTTMLIIACVRRVVTVTCISLRWGKALSPFLFREELALEFYTTAPHTTISCRLPGRLLRVQQLLSVVLFLL